MSEAPSAAAAGTIEIGGDLKVNRLGFGAMRITGNGIWGPPADHAAALAVLRRAVELGVDFVDTADSYGPDVSEELIAEALHPYPDGLVVATKGGLVRPGPGRWDPDGRPEHLREALEGSLRRLRVEQVALYQLHRPDPRVPFAESLGALAEMQAEGKIRHVGLSNVTVAQIEEARAQLQIVSVQNRYNVSDRSSAAVLAYCEREGLAFLPWAPIQQVGAGGVVAEIAGHSGCSEHQLVLAWMLARSPSILPIPGTGSVAHLEDNVRAASIRLSREDVAALDGDAA
jgi:pyridoxine 4-dehydrogenase